MAFWVIAVGVTVLLAGWFCIVLARGGNAGRAADFDLSVYRDQLAEVERDLSRGVLGEEAAERARAEIGRRILAVDRRAQNERASGGIPTRAVAAATLFAAVASGGALWLYDGLGAPGYPDMPMGLRVEMAKEARAARPSQAASEAETPTQIRPDADPRLTELVNKLRQILSTRDGDEQGLTLLARNEAAIGNYPGARTAQERLVALKGSEATVDDLIELLDLMVIATGGAVSPQADAVIARILEADPANGTARFYVGLMEAQIGRPDLAFQMWRKLLEEGPEDARWMPPVRQSITSLAQLAGVDYAPPPVPGTRGPSAEDIAAASSMSDTDRTAMIRGMVQGLADRLASEGGPPEDWAKLLNALGVLGDKDWAGRIWGEAQKVFADKPTALALVRQGAVAAGVAP